MPGSATSLDTLSSPSPSPSPPDNNKLPEPSNAGLGTDSELSELTEEEQEIEKKRGGQKGQGRNSRNEVNGHTRSRQQARRGRRKRSSIVPAPMWGWAGKVVQEEEEEAAGPPRVMEEEEGEEDSGPAQLSSSRSGYSSRVANGKHVDDDEIEEGEYREPTADQPDDALDSADEVPQLNRTSRKISRRPPGSGGRSPRGHQSGSLSSGSGDEADHPPPVLDNDGDDDAAEGDEDLSDADDAGMRMDDVESEDGSEVDDDDLKAPTGVLGEKLTESKQPTKSPSPSMMDVELDVPGSGSAPITLSSTIVAASSIMAGVRVLEAPSPSPSQSSGRQSPSRSPSPIHSRITSDLGVRDGLPPSLRDKAVKRNADKDDVTGSNKRVSSSLDLVDEPDGKEDLTANADPDRSADDIEADAVSPENDLELEMELESDLQPAHRAEALDVLAMIELKFALLRERLYVEKMESLAWEESLVSDGTHPELIHLLAELGKRRDKRIDLATRRRQYEVTNVVKRRKLDEDATWSWWKNGKDDLQMDMISETNRKRRRLEQDRKAVERPQSFRRIPQPPQEVSAPPSLRQVLKAIPYSQQFDGKSKSTAVLPIALEYPEVTSLTPLEINHDLELLFQHRRVVQDPYRMGAPAPAMNQLPPHMYDSFGIDIAGPPHIGPGSRMLPPPHPVQHYIPQPSATAFSGPPVGPERILPQQSPTLNSHVHSQGYPPDELTGPSQQVPYHPYFGSAQNKGGMRAGHDLRRTPSPANFMPNGSNPKQNAAWSAMGTGAFAGPKNNDWGSDTRRGEMLANDDDAKHRKEHDKREREHDFDRGKDSYHQPSVQQLHRHSGGPQLPHHQLVHSNSTQPVGHHSTPHHHHHHHILHHHHSPASASANIPSASPRAIPVRDFDGSRPPQPAASAEVVHLSSKTASTTWKSEEPLPPPDYREPRTRNGNGGRPDSGPPPISDRDRPLAMPFVLSSTHALPPSHSSPNAHANGMASPRNSWNPDDASYRAPPPPSSGFHGSPDQRASSPGPSRFPGSSAYMARGTLPQPPFTRQGSTGLSPPRTRSIPQSPSHPSSYPSAQTQSPTRFGPPQPPNHSPILKMQRPSSPPLTSKLLTSSSAAGGPAPPTATLYSPRLAGPGRTSTPPGALSPSADIRNPPASSLPPSSAYNGSRTASPLVGGLSYASPSHHPNFPPLSTRPPLGPASGLSLPDRERERERERERLLSPRLAVLPAPKMNVAQMIDGQ